MIFFSKNLKFLREREGIKQSDLAQKIGVKANTISNYEKDVSQPDYNILHGILTVFNIDADTLLYKDVSQKDASRILNLETPKENVLTIDRLLTKIDTKDVKIEVQAEQIGALKQTIRQLEEKIMGLQQHIRPDTEFGTDKASAGSTRTRKGGVAGSEDARFAEL